MPVNQIPFRRGGKDYTLHIGTENNNSVLFVDQAEPDDETGNPVRWYPTRLDINFTAGTGTVAYIKTDWQRNILGANGQPIRKTESPRDMVTNQVDQAGFIQMFGMPILMSMGNGFIRAILGHNAFPVFNPQTGAVLTYTAAEMEEEPTNDYHPSANPVNP